MTLRLSVLNAEAEKPTLWDNPEAAQELLKEKNRLEKALAEYQKLSRDFEDTVELIALAEDENDEETLREASQHLKELHSHSQQKSLECLLSGEADYRDAYLEVHSGAGGTEAQDWALMLYRMYLRWAEKKGYKTEILEESAGEEAGIKSATIKIAGENAYGWLKTESGVHRLVRISPFDSNAKRHTSFASIGVFPVIDDTIDIQVEEKDLKIDTYRASGAGGQHVNTTDSAVRITHIPTGIVVQCQSDRSQHRNRATAHQMLKARLYERELQRREAEATADNAAKSEMGWGHQIRSYVLHPYQMVKDLRTGVETSQTQSVLDGEIDLFLEGSLAKRIQGNQS